MFYLISHVKICVVGSPVLPHFPDDVQPALAQTSHSLGVSFSAFAQSFIVDFCPSALRTAFVGEELHGLAEVLVAVSAHVNLMNLAGLITDRGRSRQALEGLGLAKKRPVASDLAQQARGQLCPGPWQRAKQSTVRMAFEKRFDAFAVYLELGMKNPQLPGFSHRVDTFGSDCRRGYFPFSCILESSDAFFAGLRTPELVGVKEFLPLATPGFLQSISTGESLDECPRTGRTPVIKCFQGTRKILVESLLELIDEPGTFFDECHFVSAENAQFKNDGILLGKSPPSVAVKAQGIGKRPGIVPVGLADRNQGVVRRPPHSWSQSRQPSTGMP